MVSQEIFVIDYAPEVDAQSAKAAQVLRAKATLAENLGLTAQVATLNQEIAVLERGNRLSLQALTPGELAVWREWLPTSYRENDAPRGHGQSDLLKVYSFDRIPQPVLRKWNALKEKNIFDRFEIWTPERQTIDDPALVGVIGNAYYMVTRWGESDANLLSFEDIRRKVLRRIVFSFERMFLPLFLIAAIAGLVGWGAAAALISLFQGSQEMAPWGAAFAAFGAVVACFWAVWNEPNTRLIRQARQVDRELEPASAS